MDVEELIKLLLTCDPKMKIGTYSNGHHNDSSHYRSHGGISLAIRNGDLIIGNFNGYGLPTKAPYSYQFRDAITLFIKDAQ